MIDDIQYDDEGNAIPYDYSPQELVAIYEERRQFIARGQAILDDTLALVLRSAKKHLQIEPLSETWTTSEGFADTPVGKRPSINYHMACSGDHEIVFFTTSGVADVLKGGQKLTYFMTRY